VTMPPPLRLDARRGPHRPSAGSPARMLGSVRRTTTIDLLRPAGLLGPVTLVGLGRDLRTRETGVDAVSQARVDADIEYMNGRALRDLTTTPARPALSSLRGSRVASGFRALALDADPDLPDEADLLYQLVDDVPGATLVSGHACVAGSELAPLNVAERSEYQYVADLCAGWVTGGSIMIGIGASGRPPIVKGPAAPTLVDDTDPWSWHQIDALPVHGVRRARRIDVVLDRSAGVVDVDSIFRDSYMGPDGTETVIHEYTVTAKGDVAAGVVTACEAEARVLPWLECPGAAASAGRVVGMSWAELRGYVRAALTGTTTCTHLNDALRSLAGVPHLLAHLDPSHPE